MMATWKLSNRRSFAALKRLWELAPTGPWPQQAMALAQAGDLALALVVETAGDPSSSSNRSARRVWKAMKPDSGASATVFLTHGIAAATGRLASSPGHHLSSERQQEARAVLQRHFPWSEADEAELIEVVEQIDPGDASGWEQAQVGVALGAVQRIVGDAAIGLPGFAGYAGDDLDAYLANLAWQNCFNSLLPPYLAVTDPAGLAKWRTGSESGGPEGLG